MAVQTCYREWIKSTEKNDNEENH